MIFDLQRAVCGAAALLLFSAALGSAGCASLEKNETYRSIIGQTVLGLPQSGPQSGPESIYLTDAASQAPKDTLSPNSPLIPLQTGNFWQMKTARGDIYGKETMIVTGQTQNGWGQSGVGVEVQRNNKRFRYEIYRQDKKGLYLLAAKDETSDMMSYDPPIPLAPYPSKEGATLLWRGKVKIGKFVLPSAAISRFSTQETTKTDVGMIHVFRIDTMVSINQNGRDVRFPSVRWLAPGIGFVRRGYAENNETAMSEVTKFNVR